LLLAAEVAIIGPRLELEYWTREANRIASIDERTQPLGQELPASFLKTLPRGDGSVTIDGRTYHDSVLEFSHNATLLRPLLKDHHVHRVTMSLMLSCAFLVAIGVTLGRRFSARFEPHEDLAFALLGVCGAVSLGPFSWLMALVLVLPAVVIIPRMWTSGHRWMSIVAATALLAIGSPVVFPIGVPGRTLIQFLQYPFATAVLGAALLAFLRTSLGASNAAHPESSIDAPAET
jgi:hypothetical protein